MENRGATEQIEAETRESSSGEQFERRAITSPEFGAMMVHFYRGEISRANIWRQRLDTTFNWAVITTGGTLSFAFGSTVAPHFVILMNSLLMTVFLFIEARRYRYYELWSSRVRVIETDYIAPLLSRRTREQTPHDAWREHLAEDLLRPHFTVGLWEAVGRRLRRNYIWIFLLLALAWNIKIAIHPTAATGWDEYVARAAVGNLNGYIVLAIGFIYNGLLFAIAFLTTESLPGAGESAPKRRFRLRRTARRRRRRRDLPHPETSATFKPVQRQRRGTTESLRARDEE